MHDFDEWFYQEVRKYSEDVGVQNILMKNRYWIKKGFEGSKVGTNLKEEIKQEFKDVNLVYDENISLSENMEDYAMYWLVSGISEGFRQGVNYAKSTFS